MAKLFITGATGYIGGDALHAISKAHPALGITALARNSDKGAKIAAQYPKVNLVYGSLEDADLLKTEAAKADVVLHTANADDLSAAKAIIAGLAQKQTPGYLIHTSGTGNVATADAMRRNFGVYGDKVYDDWDGIGELTSLPDFFAHRDVDKAVLSASEKNPGNIFTAIVAPPVIYGPGRGPDNQRSVQAPDMSRITLMRGKGFQVGEGKNAWNGVHVQDLSDLFLALVTSALQPDGGKATWNSEGYYIAEAHEVVWGDISRAIAKIAADKKLIATPEVDKVDPMMANRLRGGGAFLWGTNAKVKAFRANKLLGWTPKQQTLMETLPDLLDEEAKLLGLIKGHAEKASSA